MDMSLDEIIKSKRSASRGRRRGDGRQGGSRNGSNRRGGAGGCSNFRSNGSVGNGFGPMRRNRSMARRFNGYSPYAKGDVNASWTHDMYEGHQRQQIRSGLPTTDINKIVISNLDFGVMSRDIQTLFKEFKSLKTATVHYDRSGRSLGRAEVTFDNKIAALKAIHQYNNVPLDRRPMKIKLVTHISRPTSITVRGTRGDGGGIWKIRGNTKEVCGNNRRNSRGRCGRGGRDIEKEMLNKDKLDQQLDNFLKSRNDNV